MLAFQVISGTGAARNAYIEAIGAAKASDMEHALSLIEEGNNAFTESHQAHDNLLEREASGEFGMLELLILHAEDQLVSAEGFKTIALELIDNYQRVRTLEEQVQALQG